MPLNNPAATAQIKTGTYTGNAGANLAVPHGLTSKPKLVILTNLTNSTDYATINTEKDGSIVRVAGNVRTGITAMNMTNFYVGDGVNHQDTMNINARVYEFVAFA